MTTLDQNEAIALGILTAKGKSLALAMVEAENQKRTILLDIASLYLTKEKYDIVLDSYESTLIERGVSANSAKVRKSEALQVIKAVSLTQVSNANLSALKTFVGGYNDMIAQARQVILLASNKPVKTPTISDNLTDKQADNVSYLFERANANQLRSFAEEATITMVNKTSPKLAGLQQLMLMASIANNMLSNANTEPFILEIATSIYSQLDDAITRIEQANKQAELVTIELQTATA